MNYVLLPDHSTKRASMEEMAKQWEEWHDAGPFDKGHPKVVDRTVLPDCWVSTVFLGLDHNFDGGPPILFETMVFASESLSDKYCERYETWDEAYAGHQEVVRKIQAGELDLEEEE